MPTLRTSRGHQIFFPQLSGGPIELCLQPASEPSAAPNSSELHPWPCPLPEMSCQKPAGEFAGRSAKFCPPRTGKNRLLVDRPVTLYLRFRGPWLGRLSAFKNEIVMTVAPAR